MVLAARRRDVLEATAGELRAITGGTVHVEEVNIRDLDAVAALAERQPDVDILVNNAGGHFAQKAVDYSPNGWRTVVDLNLNGTWNMIQTFGRRMLASEGGGAICSIVMTVGRGMPGLAHSGAARAGVVELTRTLSWEWGPRVRLNGVAPARSAPPDGTRHDDGVGGRGPATARVRGHAVRSGQCRDVPGVAGRRLRHRPAALRRRRPHQRRPPERPPRRQLPRTPASAHRR